MPRPTDSSSEGDVNRSPRRQHWQDDHLSPAARQLVDQDARIFLHQSLSTPCLNALEGVEGIYLIDTAGRRIMDFHGNSAHQVGYGHPAVIAAIKAQLEAMSFCPRRYTNGPAVELAEKLASLAPGRLNKVLLTTSGATANSIALQIARHVTGRHKTIAMQDSFHGATLDTISVGGSSLFRDGLGPLLPGNHHVPWPRSVADADQIEQLFEKEKEIGAVIAEPMRCTTIERPPNDYWRRVRELCQRHGALLIFDEIPLALGRTGTMFCCEHTGVIPDVITLGKGLGGCIWPCAAVIVREDLDVMSDRAIGHFTHEKSPVGAAAALATIQVIEDEQLLAHSQRLGELALERLRDMKTRHPIIHEVRGAGLALGVELRRGTEKALDEAEQVMYSCLSRGLSFKLSAGNVLTLTPPLVITEAQLFAALEIVESALLSSAN